VHSLKVNNKTPLEEWFPFSVENAKSAEVLGRIYSEKQKNLDFLHDHTPNAKPYPAEKVTSIKADPIERFVIDLAG
jgi:hypothetical protein